ncbi:hypothetical protein EJB05_21110 [Eragrostis curvula]|uniref:Bifunctional inhibitor/plant lipid transfer protein/seed storage helical domain-containing protein n=1 Tax=Eragrostis curvula TaxID=38414 RepID=A0A5J9V2H6_9POAL|nr:hypothetical protein EJB05_21110 [Eragrostis curvula]
MRRRAHHAAPLLHLLVVIVSCRLAGAGAAATGVVAAAGAPDGLPSEHLFPCLEELLPCTAYLKAAPANKHPSNTCCTAMHRAAAADEMPCMCRLLADPELLATFNVTTDQTFKLPSRCVMPVGCRDGDNHEPVVEAPPPPAGKQQHHYVFESSGDGFRSGSVWWMIASAVLGGMVLVAAVF